MVSTVKVLSLGILFLMSCVSGLALPYLILRVLSRNCQNSKTFKKVLGVLNCFSGGVFIATSLLTLLPEGREAAENAFQMMDNDMDYPITELLLGFGFLLILIIESVTVSCYSRHHKDLNTQDTCRNQETGNNKLKTSTESNGPTHNCNEFCASYQNGHVTVIPVRQEEDGVTQISQAPSVPEADLPQANHCLTEKVYSEGMSNLHSVVLLIALSIHMIFDGLSLGLLTEDDEIWSVLIALGLHKILIFLSTGITLRESTTTIKFIIAMLYLAIVSPIGVGIGILLTSQSANVALTTVSAFLQAFAVGTFVYVAFFEILLKEFSPDESGRIVKAISTVAGYSIFALISYVMH